VLTNLNTQGVLFARALRALSLFIFVALFRGASLNFFFQKRFLPYFCSACTFTNEWEPTQVSVFFFLIPASPNPEAFRLWSFFFYSGLWSSPKLCFQCCVGGSRSFGYTCFFFFLDFFFFFRRCFCWEFFVFFLVWKEQVFLVITAVLDFGGSFHLRSFLYGFPLFFLLSLRFDRLCNSSKGGSSSNRSFLISPDRILSYLSARSLER